MKNKIFNKLIKPSTRSFYREGKKLPNYSFWDWLHGYVYARWPYFYIGVGTREHRLAKLLMPIWRIVSKKFHFESDGKDDSNGVTFADTYHGKVVPLEQASQLVTVNKSIDLGDLEQVIPYTRARDIVLFNPDTVIDNASFVDPHQFPTGIEYVLVNGKITIENGKHTGAQAGSVLRHPSA